MQPVKSLAGKVPVASQLYRRARELSRQIHGAQQSLNDIFQIFAEERIDGLLSKPRYSDPRRLNRFEHKVFSQMGEDGITAEIFTRIGAPTRTFVEFGVGNGLENNTLYLLVLGWKGAWVEACEENKRAIMENMSGEIQGGNLCLLNEFVTAENVETLVNKAGVPDEFDLLSIDIDMNSYWIWKAINSYRPRAVVIEYNAIFPPGCEWVVPYAPEAVWDGTSWFGASLTSLEHLGRQKGYSLVGCNLGGVNAFFVRDDLVGDNFCGPFTSETHFEPPRYYLANLSAGHPRAVRQTPQGASLRRPGDCP